MKKIYQTPEIEVMTVAPASIIAMSGNDEMGDGNQLVKERNFDEGSSNRDYNVWDDDWSR